MLKLAYLAPAILEKLLITVANPGRTISALMLGWLDGPGGYHAMFGAIWPSAYWARALLCSPYELSWQMP